MPSAVTFVNNHALAQPKTVDHCPVSKFQPAD